MSSYIYRNPKNYSNNNALQYNFAMQLLKKIILDRECRVLDIGCGDGLITHEISRIVTKGCVLGTDISEQMIEFASNKYINQNNLRFLIMDAKKNIFREQFDIITSFNCLHWIKEQQNAILGIANAAVHGGQIALLLSHKKSLYHMAIDKICSSRKWKNYFIQNKTLRYFFDINEYKEIILKSNLELVEISEETMSYNFDSIKQLKEFFNAAGSQIKYIPEAHKYDFLNDFTQEYCNMANIYEGHPIPVSFWCLQVIATKPKY